MTDKNEESEIFDQLFGISDGEIIETTVKSTQIESENETNSYNSDNSNSDSDLKEKKNTKKNKKRSNESEVEEGKEDNTDDKIFEARRDFEEALSKLKGGRRKREADSDSVNYDDMAVAFVNKMYDALRKDDEAVKAEKPALSKLKMLDEVTEMLTRKHLQEVFLDNQILDALKKWLEPNIRGQISVPTIRKRLLELLKNLPIETVHLRESGIGRIVMFYYQRRTESLEIRKLAGDLITTWSRPILGTLLDYTEMIQSATTKNTSVDDDQQPGNNTSSIKRLQSDNFKKMVKSGALEKESGGDQRYRQLINRQKNRKRE